MSVELMRTELADGGRTLKQRGVLAHPRMRVVLSPQESRHEAIVRVLVGMVGVLDLRVKALEGVGSSGDGDSRELPTAGQPEGGDPTDAGTEPSEAEA